MPTIGSRPALVSLIACAALTLAAFSAQAQTPQDGHLVPGTKLTYRYAMMNQDFSSESSAETVFGFISCEFIAMHGVENGAFRVECDSGPKNPAVSWRPWSEDGYYAWRADGLHHVTSPTSSELRFPAKPRDTSWVPRSILALGEPVNALCPAATEPQAGQAVFEEVCWTPGHGPVFFVGVDTRTGIAEASWELLKVGAPGEREATKVSVKAAKKLVKGWLWAQNTSRLQNYGWLYGAVFHGVERGAAGTGSFDRSAWLKKRKKLFQRRTRIRIEDMKVLALGDTTVVLFEQHRDLGGQVDTGLRELRLDLERGRVVIAREEMLYAQAL